MIAGDAIKRRGTKRVWIVLRVHPDGLIDVERRASGRAIRRTIMRPEDYSRVKEGQA